MTTSHSPLRILKAQADAVAKSVKQIERGEKTVVPIPAEVREYETFKFAVVMDDKQLILDMKWTEIEKMSEVALAAYILKLMRGSRETTH